MAHRPDELSKLADKLTDCLNPDRPERGSRGCGGKSPKSGRSRCPVAAAYHLLEKLLEAMRKNLGIPIDTPSNDPGGRANGNGPN